MNEKLLTAADVAALPPNPNPNTVRNWMQVGCRKIKLGHDVIGGRYYTDAKRLQEFYDALKARHTGRKQVAKERNGDVLKRLRAKHGIG